MGKEAPKPLQLAPKVETKPQLGAPVKFVRAKRKGNGWVVETVLVPAELLASLKPTEVGDWDQWPQVERKLYIHARPVESVR